MIDVLQITYNILDQRMNDTVLDKAESKGTGILDHSVYLKGVLTERAKYLPEHCAPLRRAAERARKTMNLTSRDDLSSSALRFALSNSRIDSVFVGVGCEAELDFALDAFNEGKFSNNKLDLAYHCRMDDKFWLNPSNWGIN